MSIPVTSQMSVAGMGKSGKTYFVKNHIIKNMPRKYRVAVYDPLGEYHKTRDNMEITVELANTRNFNRWIGEKYKQGNTFVIAEQAEAYLPQRLNLAKYPNIQWFVQAARHRNCGMVAVTRRFSCLSTTVVALSDYVFMFRMFAPSDLRQASMYLHNWKDLPTLKRGWFYQFCDKGETLCSPIKNRG